MGNTEFLKTRVSGETKRLVQLAARRQLLNESVWIRRDVDSALRGQRSGVGLEQVPPRVEKISGLQRTGVSARLCIRLRPDDRLMLLERANSRSMASGTYLSVLLRAHLRNLPPLPQDELLTRSLTISSPIVFFGFHENA